MYSSHKFCAFLERSDLLCSQLYALQITHTHTHTRTHTHARTHTHTHTHTLYHSTVFGYSVSYLQLENGLKQRCDVRIFGGVSDFQFTQFVLFSSEKVVISPPPATTTVRLPKWDNKGETSTLVHCIRQDKTRDDQTP